MVDDQGRLKDGKLAAIKVLSAESRQGVKEFLTEINVISEIEHENLVKLYGCCVERNNRILVYNYLENNCLSQTLLGKCTFFYIYFIWVNVCFFTSTFSEYCWRKPFAEAFWAKLEEWLDGIVILTSLWLSTLFKLFFSLFTSRWRSQ